MSDASARTFRASPNLALVKYWGKADQKNNTPATPSLGITLGDLETITTVQRGGEEDEVIIEEIVQDPGRFAAFFDAFREVCPGTFFKAESRNSFPTAAGLASSSSGFAALSCACAAAAEIDLTPEEISGHARIGSASAARSVFGGFVSLEAGATHAVQAFDEDHWPDLRVVLVAVRTGPKGVSSRKAMELSRTTSPYYDAWVSSSPMLYAECVSAVKKRDIEKLGTVARQSYLRMFGTMFSSAPPVVYWHSDSLEVISLCARMRDEGIPAWETMDAGPQVKILCLEDDLPVILERVAGFSEDWKVLVSSVGPGPREIT